MRTTSGQNWLQVMREKAAQPGQAGAGNQGAAPVPQLRPAAISGQNMVSFLPQVPALITHCDGTVAASLSPDSVHCEWWLGPVMSRPCLYTQPSPDRAAVFSTGPGQGLIQLPPNIDGTSIFLVKQ